jgi:hypothetical protein
MILSILASVVSGLFPTVLFSPDRMRRSAVAAAYTLPPSHVNRAVGASHGIGPSRFSAICKENATIRRMCRPLPSNGQSRAPGVSEKQGDHGKTLDFRPASHTSWRMNSITPFPASHGAPEQVSFHRTELSVILSLYGRMVAAGEWRDYGISTLRDVAVFSVFRRTAENPLYRIEKRPKLRNRQGQYAVIGVDGQVLKRGQELRTVLRVLDRKLIRAVE